MQTFERLIPLVLQAKPGRVRVFRVAQHSQVTDSPRGRAGNSWDDLPTPSGDYDSGNWHGFYDHITSAGLNSGAWMCAALQEQLQLWWRYGWDDDTNCLYCLDLDASDVLVLPHQVVIPLRFIKPVRRFSWAELNAAF